MYTLVDSYVRRNRRSGRWEHYDVSDVPVTILNVVYGDVWLMLEFPSSDGVRALRFDLVANWVTQANSAQTVQEWLSSLGNQTLPLADEVPQFRERLVRYTQAWHAGYEISTVPRLGPSDSVASEYHQSDLLLKHPTLDPEYVATHALVSVNGFFHICDYNADGVRVHGGNRTIRRANDNQIGILSFAEVGAIEQVPITADMLHSQGVDIPLLDGTYLTIPESVDLTGKTVLLVVGGYLQVLGKTYTRVGERSYKVELSKLMMIERYYDSYQILDLSSLGLTEYDNPSLLELDQIRQDEVVRRYLTLEQSFLVVVDQPALFHELVPVENTRLPGRWYDRNHHNEPLVGAYGRGIEYSTIYEEGISVLAGSVNLRHHYDLQHRQWAYQRAVDGSRVPSTPFNHTHAYKRLLGCEA